MTPTLRDLHADTVPLAELDVLVVDCQATGASPRGQLLELGWTCFAAGPGPTRTRSRLIRLAAGERIPPAVARITGISAEEVAQRGVEAKEAWRELSADAATLPRQPAPAVAHFMRFEQPFLSSLAGGVPPLELVCTHEIARRLMPDLPRCSLRALAGYFGRAVGPLRRSAEHVEATAFVWRQLLPMLADEGISTWSGLRDWLTLTARPKKLLRRAWPMARELRLSLPNAPGVYRLLRTSGDVLYVGKAISLHHRVNSYFRKQHEIHERTLEMLSQARALSFEVTPSPLEAALLETDEIKRHAPPYNIALAAADRHTWFASRDFFERRTQVSARCPLGPFPSAELIDQLAALARACPTSLGAGRWAPPAAVFEAGYLQFRAAHPELSREKIAAHTRLLLLGARLWREGRRDRDSEPDETNDAHAQLPWTPGWVQLSLEWLVLRSVLALRRATWLTRLVDAAIVWTERGLEGARLLVLEGGEIVVRASVAPGTLPPVPPGHPRAAVARREAFTVARLDRLRVLSTELKRLVADGAPVCVRFGPASMLAGTRLHRALSRV